MNLLIFLLGTAFGICAYGIVSIIVSANSEGATVELYADLVHDTMLLVFILALLQVFLQL